MDGVWSVSLAAEKPGAHKTYNGGDDDEANPYLPTGDAITVWAVIPFRPDGVQPNPKDAYRAGYNGR